MNSMALHITWIVLATTVVHVLLDALKSDRVDGYLFALSIPSIPTRAIPWLSLALGFASGALEHVTGANGSDWPAAILGGLMTGFGSIAFHEIRKPSPENVS